MTKSNAGFLAFVAVAVAAAIGAFFVSPKLFKANVDTASQSAPASAPAEQAAPAEAPGPDAGDATEIASADAAAPDTAQSWVVPSFDVLRVEPDGSTVIAGKAEPGTTLEIMNGEDVVASTKVGPSGDFAAVLDTPLAAGDYQLSLRIRDGEGGSRLSEEVATVSIPKDPGGELLAMVSRPGKASRILAQPTAADEKPAGEGATTADAADGVKGADAPVETASAAPKETADRTPAPDATGPETAAAEQGPAPETASNGTDATGPAEVANVETPALPEASSLLTTSAPEISGQPETVGEADGAEVAGASGEASEPVSAEQANPAQETAMAAPEATQPEEEAKPETTVLPAGATVRVDAVEIEGERMFVAGSAPPGFTVRVMADGQVIGTEKADETGRFIIEARSALSVGDHIISADLMDGTGEDVLLRATVPFQRPEGEALAAVAPSVPAAGDTAANGPQVVADIAELSRLREASFEALSKLQEMASASGEPDQASLSSAYDDAVAQLRAAASAELADGAGTEAMAMAQAMRSQAQAALEAILPPSQPAAASEAKGEGDPVDPAALRQRVERAETALSEPSAIAVAAAETDESTPSGEAGEPRTIVQAPLAKAPGAVIIRRGDTLWQISRRTYGQGVRYTTIYVANRSQIQNPDRIKPGQVFSVPDSPLDNAEEMHKQLLGGPKTP